MNRINPLNNPQFPASSNTWEFVQEMVTLVSKLAGVGGQNYILSGCTDNGISVTAGNIVVNGELIAFAGGPKLDTIIIEEVNSNVVAGGVTYNNVFTSRTARFGAGVGQINWATFVRLPTILEVNQRITDLINTAPAALDTLKELADALNNDANFAASVAQSLALKANSADVYTRAQIDARLATENAAGFIEIATNNEFKDSNVSDKAIVPANFNQAFDLIENALSPADNDVTILNSQIRYLKIGRLVIMTVRVQLNITGVVGNQILFRETNINYPNLRAHTTTVTGGGLSLPDGNKSGVYRIYDNSLSADRFAFNVTKPDNSNFAVGNGIVCEFSIVYNSIA